MTALGARRSSPSLWLLRSGLRAEKLCSLVGFDAGFRVDDLFVFPVEA